MKTPGLLASSQPYFLSGESSRRGKAGAAWGCRPTEHPLPTPAGNPAGSRPTRTSLWPGQFLGKTDACHKPLGKRHPALVLRDSPVLGGGLQSVLFPGEELRANGEPGRTEAVKGRAVSRKAAFRSSEMWPVAAVRVAKRAKGARRSEYLEGRKARASGTGRQAALAFGSPEYATPFAQRSKGSRCSAARIRLPPPAVRRGVMRKEKGVRGLGAKLEWCKVASAQRSTLTRSLHG